MTRVVLVHGFWADGSSWAGVISQLLSADPALDITAVQLPLSTFTDDVATVRRAVALRDEPTLLVGHSYGGVVISEAAVGASVGGLVYVSAYAPELGESVDEINAKYPPAGGGSAIRPTDDGHLWLDIDGFADAFAADVAPATAAVMARTQGPASFACLSGLTTPPAWHDLPSWFVISTEDRTIAPDAQRWMATRMGANITEVAGSHASLVSHPDVLGDVISRALAATA